MWKTDDDRGEISISAIYCWACECSDNFQVLGSETKRPITESRSVWFAENNTDSEKQSEHCFLNTSYGKKQEFLVSCCGWLLALRKTVTPIIFSFWNPVMRQCYVCKEISMKMKNPRQYFTFYIVSHFSSYCVFDIFTCIWLSEFHLTTWLWICKISAFIRDPGYFLIKLKSSGCPLSICLFMCWILRVCFISFLQPYLYTWAWIFADVHIKLVDK